MTIKKVLLVDDDPDIRSIGTLSLRNVGKWQVVVADSGPAALKLVAQERPELMLLDVVMPGMDGPQTLRLLRELRDVALPKVIFLTAKTQAEEHKQLIELGAQGVILKPFNPLLLPRQICQILDSVR